MRQRLVYTFGLIVLGLVALAASPTNAQTVAPGPYYANPSWDQTLACTTLATCPRFIVLSNMNSAAVLDRETGLVWEQSPNTGAKSWVAAQDFCNTTNVGNRLGWRLPTVQELASLVPLPAGNPFINVQVSTTSLPLPGFPPIITAKDRYWSATTSSISAANAWRVAFSTGSVAPGPKTSEDSSFAWCVRGGQGVDPQ